MEEKKGLVRTVWLSHEMDSMLAEAAEKLGVSRSLLWKYALMKLLQELNVLSDKLREAKT